MKKHYIIWNIIRLVVFTLIGLIIYSNWNNFNSRNKGIMVLVCGVITLIFIIVPEIIFAVQRRKLRAAKAAAERPPETQGEITAGEVLPDSAEQEEQVKTPEHNGLRGQLIAKENVHPVSQPPISQTAPSENKENQGEPAPAAEPKPDPAVGKWTCGLCGTENNDTAVCECCGTPRE